MGGPGRGEAGTDSLVRGATGETRTLERRRGCLRLCWKRRSSWVGRGSGW